MCVGYLWAWRPAVPLGWQGHAERAIGRIDHLRDVIVFRDFDPDAELFGFGSPLT